MSREGVISIRASSFGEIFDDALRWRAKQIDGRRMPASGRSWLGSAVHSATAWYDQAIIDGKEPTAEQAVREFVSFYRTLPSYEVVWHDIAKEEGERIGAILTSRYVQEIAPEFTFVEVERECAPLQVEIEGVELEFTGTLDRIREKDGAYGLGEVKTGGRIIADDGEVAVEIHGPQLAIYELLEIMAARETGYNITLPAVVFGLSTRKDPDIGWREIPNPRRFLFGDDEHVGLLEAAAKIIKHELWVGNPKSSLCSSRYCPIFPCFYMTQESA